ncbi:MAG: FtsX-like permease family protein [Lachnospiraceae bacterium]|nr:FtsX-like permease family protein [Lachnospiraceae bacterium]
MFRIMLQKIWHKKWMGFSLLLGSMLLIATVVSFPMYKTAAFDRMLQDEFTNYQSENSDWPAMNKMVIISKKDATGSAIRRMEELMAEINTNLGVTEKETILYYAVSKMEAKSTMNRDDIKEISLRLGMMTDLPAHAKISSGEMYSEDGLTDDGCIEVLISQATMVSSKLLLGEEVEFTALKGIDGKPIRIKVVGVFEEADRSDLYWQVSPDETDGVCLMQEDLFKTYFTGERAGGYTLTCTYFPMFEYEDIKAEEVSQIREYTEYLTQDSPYRSTMSEPTYKVILDEFVAKQDRISATLFILQIPVLVLLCAFLFMISTQMYDMERNEISVIKSRGASGGQIFRLYFYQCMLLTLLGAAVGIPLGSVFCRILGATGNFLEFSVTRSLTISYTQDVWTYALVAGLGVLLITTLPALKHSRLSIVKLKQQKALKQKVWWETCFLDIIALGVSLYGYYSFKKNEEALAQAVLMGEPLDPLLYLSSSLFIVGLGLLGLRLQPLLVQLLYLIGKRWWKPASYASFMENLKNGKKQQFIMLFMILTVSLGMFHSTVARTILSNAQENVAYLDGADIILKEVWQKNAAMPSMGDNQDTSYIEPDISKYAGAPGMKSYTKVIMDEKGFFKLKGSVDWKATIMGIHTKEFGLSTDLDDALLEQPYYAYLNALAVDAQGVLVSSNFADQFGYKVGDVIDFANSEEAECRGRIVGIFDYWPGYAPSQTTLNPDGTVNDSGNFLIIANYATLEEKWGVVPYELWISTESAEASEQFKEWVVAQDIHIQKFVDREKDLKDVVLDPLLQGTNGVLTMGFIVTIILCGVGYLIYWVMSIRSREMLFGVLRACGMHKKEIFHMLINEQIFSGLFSILVGVGVGKITSDMFVPVLQTAYAASNQILPMKLITNPDDLLRLYAVIGLVMVLCLLILLVLVLKMNVAKALKLGEE